MSAAELAEMLFRALRDGDLSSMRAGASEAVSRYAGMEPGRPVGGTYYLYRTLRNLELEELHARLVGENTGDGLSQRLARDEASARIEQLKAEIEREIRERLVEDRGAAVQEAADRTSVPPSLAIPRPAQLLADLALAVSQGDGPDTDGCTVAEAVDVRLRAGDEVAIRGLVVVSVAGEPGTGLPYRSSDGTELRVSAPIDLHITAAEPGAGVARC